MTRLLIRIGSKVIQEGVGTNQEPESKAEPLSVNSSLSWVKKAGILPGISCHHCRGDPHFPAVLSTGHGALGSGLIGGITNRGMWAHLGEPLLLTVHTPPQF